MCILRRLLLDCLLLAILAATSFDTLWLFVLDMLLLHLKRLRLRVQLVCLLICHLLHLGHHGLHHLHKHHRILSLRWWVLSSNLFHFLMLPMYAILFRTILLLLTDLFLRTKFLRTWLFLRTTFEAKPSTSLRFRWTLFSNNLWRLV